MLNTLWTILLSIFVLSGLLVYRSIFRNWSIKAKIFLCVSQLCLCCVLLALGVCSNQHFITNIGNILVIFSFFMILKDLLNRLEKESAEKALEVQKSRSNKSDIIDAEEYTIYN